MIDIKIDMDISISIFNEWCGERIQNEVVLRLQKILCNL